MATLGLGDRQDGDKGQTTPHEALTSSEMEGRHIINKGHAAWTGWKRDGVIPATGVE